MKRMTKQVQAMVRGVNEVLKINHVKTLSDSLFVYTSWLLCKADCYHGFNYFTEDGKLSNEEDKKFDHLEFYIL